MTAMADETFARFLASLQAQTTSAEVKIAMVYEFTGGKFNAHQAAMVLYNFASPVDKLRAMEMLTPKLVRMTCSEARDIIGATNIPSDKIKVLESIKRYLIDMHSREGEELIKSCYIFDSDKYNAMNVLSTVRNDEASRIPAGGHQGYAALGHLYAQSCPLNQHIYGSVNEQSFRLPFNGKITIPVMAKQPVFPSPYTGHPSYSYAKGRTYAQDKNLPGNQKYKETSLEPMLPCVNPRGY